MIRSKFDLSTTYMLLCEFFSKYNVYNVCFSFLADDSSFFPSDIISLSSFELSILQECSDYHCKFTFVTKLSPSSVMLQLDSIKVFICTKYSISRSCFTFTL